MKSIAILLGACLLSLNSVGQQVIFANTTSTLFNTNGAALGQGIGLMSGRDQYRIGLYIAPDGTTDERLFTLVRVATNQPPPFNGRFICSQNPLTIPGNSGTPIAFQVKAWSSSCGASYEAAYANRCNNGASCYLGKSAIGRVVPGIPGSPAPGLFGTGDFPGQCTNGIILMPVLDCSCRMRFSAIRASATNLMLRIEDSANCRHRLQVADAVTGPWTTLSNLITLPANGVLELNDTNPPGPRFYRTVFAP